MPFEKFFMPPNIQNPEKIEKPKEEKKIESLETTEISQAEIETNTKKLEKEEKTFFSKIREMPEVVKKAIRIFALTTILAQSAVFAEEIHIYGKSRYETTETIKEVKKEETYESQKEILNQYLKQVEKDYEQSLQDEKNFVKDYTFKIKSPQIMDKILKTQGNYLKEQLSPTKVEKIGNIQYQFFCDQDSIEKMIYYTDQKISPENILNENYREQLQKKFKTMEEIENRSSQIERLATDLNDYLILYQGSEKQNGKEHPETLYLKNKIGQYQEIIKQTAGEENIFNQNFNKILEDINQNL